MPEIILETMIFKKKQQLVIEPFDNGALILKLPDRKLIEINATASFILEHTNGKLSISEIADRLQKHHELPRKRALCDIIALYKILRNQDILEKLNHENGG